MATAEPFSSLGVPVATVMANCYENGARPPPHRHTGEKPAPYSIRGRYPVPAPWIPVYAEATGSPHFHPLMSPSQGHSDSSSEIEPFSSSMVPVATGMANCYENGARPPQHRHTGEKPAPYSIRGRYPVPAPWIPVYAEATGSPHFHPLMWLRKATVIPPLK